MGTTADKLQAVLNSKNAIRDKFNLPDDMPFSKYAENINGGGEEVTLGVVDAEGKFQPLAFSGTTASNNGDSEVVESYHSWNSTLPAPDDGSYDIDISFVTATAADIRKGKVGTDIVGNPIDGTLDLDVITATAADILEGKVSVDKDGNKLTGTLVPETGIDVSDTTATASDVKDGKKFYNADGVLTTGTNTDVNVSDTTANAPDVLNGKKFYNSAGVLTTGTLVPQSGGGGSTDFFKCAEVGPAESGDTGDSAVSTDIIVSGCDYTIINGTYTLIDSSKTGKERQWKNDNELANIYWSSENNRWEISDSGVYIALSYDDVDNPVSVTTWENPDYFWTVPPTLSWVGGSDSGSTSEMPEPFTWNGYKAILVEETATTEGETVVVVSGAGMTEANGTYKLVDSSATGYSRVWSMTNDTGTYTIKWYADDSWYLDFGDTYPWLYCDTNASENPYDTEWVAINGNEPAPTVIQQTTEGTSETKKYYTFEETLTEGLTYGNGFTPEVDKVYDGEAMIKAELSLKE